MGNYNYLGVSRDALLNLLNTPDDIIKFANIRGRLKNNDLYELKYVSTDDKSTFNTIAMDIDLNQLLMIDDGYSRFYYITNIVHAIISKVNIDIFELCYNNHVPIYIKTPNSGEELAYYLQTHFKDSCRIIANAKMLEKFEDMPGYKQTPTSVDNTNGIFHNFKFFLFKTKFFLNFNEIDALSFFTLSPTNKIVFEIDDMQTKLIEQFNKIQIRFNYRLYSLSPIEHIILT